MINLSISILVAYLIGSIPTAYIFGRLVKGIDIRTVGSGNIGATNVYRAIGKIPGFMVLFLDIVKGMIPVLLLPKLLPIDSAVIGSGIYMMILGTCVISGHIWTIFLNFKGGKGVATTAGVLIVVAPKVVGVAFILWLTAFIISRYVSVASIVAAVSLPISAVIFKMPVSTVIVFLAIAGIGIYKHKSNIVRLRRGKENKIF
jgi:acyl phosphate:glycerol-3-phosphate acyltransferase